MTEATNNEFSACDMATAAAQGFRDGVASVRPAAAVVMPERMEVDDDDMHAWQFERGFNYALARVARLNPAPTPEPASLWISVEDRLPDHGEPVQVWCEVSEGAGVAWMRFGTWYMPEPQAIGYESITHWAPLLSAPEQPAKEVQS